MQCSNPLHRDGDYVFSMIAKRQERKFMWKVEIVFQAIFHLPLAEVSSVHSVREELQIYFSRVKGMSKWFIIAAYELKSYLFFL